MRDQLKFKRDNNRENWGQKEGLSNSLMSSQTLLYRWDELVKIHIRSALKAGHKHLEAVPRLLNHFPVSPEFLWRRRTQSRRGSAPNPRRDSPVALLSHVLRTGLEAPRSSRCQTVPQGSARVCVFWVWLVCYINCPMANTVCRGSAFRGSIETCSLDCVLRGWMQTHYGLTVCTKKKSLSKHFPLISQSNGLARAAGLHPVNPIVFSRIGAGLDRSSVGCTQALFCLCG